jgi:hypothetical protein
VSEDDYAPVAIEQLDALEAGPDPDLYNAVLDLIEVVFTRPDLAQSMCSVVRAGDGTMIMRLPVPGYPQYKVFWTTDGPSIRAVFRYPG